MRASQRQRERERERARRRRARARARVASARRAFARVYYMRLYVCVQYVLSPSPSLTRNGIIAVHRISLGIAPVPPLPHRLLPFSGRRDCFTVFSFTHLLPPSTLFIRLSRFISSPPPPGRADGGVYMRRTEEERASSRTDNPARRPRTRR